MFGCIRGRLFIPVLLVVFALGLFHVTPVQADKSFESADYAPREAILEFDILRERPYHRRGRNQKNLRRFICSEIRDILSPARARCSWVHKSYVKGMSRLNLTEKQNRKRLLLNSLGIDKLASNSRFSSVMDSSVEDDLPYKFSRVLHLKFARIGAKEAIAKIKPHLSDLARNRIVVKDLSLNFIHKASFVPNDRYYSRQWNLKSIGAEAAWDKGKGDPNVIIAVIDTGVDYSHSDLSANVYDGSKNCGQEGQRLCEIPGNGIDDDGNFQVDDVRGYDFVDAFAGCGDKDCTGRDADPMDDHGHGTHVAGIIAATTNNNRSIAGVCPNCTILPIRAGFKTVDAEGRVGGNFIRSDILAGLEYAINTGADVINMSFGGNHDGYSGIMKRAANENIVLVAAAGNQGTTAKNYPAASTGVISVAATDINGELAPYSQRGSWVDVAAPGGTQSQGILGLWPGGLVVASGGTSMAAPHVAGMAGLILSHTDVQGKDMEAFIKNSVDPSPGLESKFSSGFGIINLEKALSGAQTTNGTIGGIVTDGNGFAQGIIIELSGDMNSTAVTDSNGVYLFSDIPDGTSFTVKPIANSNETFEPPMHRGVSNGGVIQKNFDVVDTATDGVTITGTVKTEDGLPLSEVELTINVSNVREVGGEATYRFSTDSSGAYSQIVPFDAQYSVAPYTNSRPDIIRYLPRVVAGTATEGQDVIVHDFTGVRQTPPPVPNPDPDPKPEPSDSYVISGKLLSEDGKPVSGTELRLSSSRDGSQTTSTNSAGTYSFNGISEGAVYTLTPIVKTGSDVERITPKSVNGRTSGSSLNITHNFVATLKDAGSAGGYKISGTVLDRSQNPVGNTKVKITIHGGSEVLVDLDSNGRYTYSGGSLGQRYYVQPISESSSHTFLPWRATSTFSANQDIEQNFIANPVRYRLSGVIEDSSGEVKSGVTVSLINRTTGETSSARTNSLGKYSVLVDKDSEVTISPSLSGHTFAPTSRLVEASRARSDLHFEVYGGEPKPDPSPAPTAKPTPNPRPTAEPTPVPSNDDIVNFSASGFLYEMVDGRKNFLRGVYELRVTATNGFSETFQSSAIGSYRHRFDVPRSAQITVSIKPKDGRGFTPQSYTVAASRLFAIEHFTADSVSVDPDDLPLVKYGSITEDGRGLSNISVTAITDSGTQTTTTDSQGNFWFRQIPTSSWVTITPSSGTYSFSPTYRKFAVSTSSFINFRATDTTPPKVSVGGVTSNQRALREAGVTLRLSGNGQSLVTTSDSRGNYRFDGVNGNSSVVITAHKSGMQFNTPSRTVVLKDYNVTRIDFVGTEVSNPGPDPQPNPQPDPQPQPSPNPQPNPQPDPQPEPDTQLWASGYAKTPEGQPIQLANIEIKQDFGRQGNLVLGYAITDLNGRYLIRVNDKGIYTLTFSKDNFRFNAPIEFTVNGANVSRNIVGVSTLSTRTFTLSGRMTNSKNGTPILGAQVRVHAPNPIDVTGDPISLNTVTDVNGYYRLDGVPSGIEVSVTHLKFGYDITPPNFTKIIMNSNKTLNFLATPEK